MTWYPIDLSGLSVGSIAEVADDALITDVVCVAKVIDPGEEKPSVYLLVSEGTDWVTQAGLIEIGKSIAGEVAKGDEI